MSPIFSLAYLTVPGTHPADLVELAALCGYDGVSPRFISMRLPGEPDFSLENDRVFQSVRDALERTGLPLMDIELARIADGINVLSYEKNIARAAELGAQYLITSVWTEDRPFALEELKKLCDLAGKYQLLVNLEFMSFSCVPTLATARRMIQDARRPNLRLMIDCLHAHRAGVTRAMLEDVPKEEFGFVHLCNGPSWIPPADHPNMTEAARSGRRYIGEGGIDVAGLLRGIGAAPYYSIELPNTEEISARGKVGHARKCLETAKSLFTDG
ncbi:sugar phosphate isomerase/epimerase [Pseudoflavonifractor sp. 60]|uniref:sugar phosphate isomerase/epimerase family protein n=1 Tax=Pseudoflavonifractor sp. 60 TaxID=2304576 RepID=UPI0013719809|nr:sugar phosphate isomerase/epimerase [Pseudoflavonifractor sp. 60]NBI66374.1 sugar phosphate isomerase/epimerase [Pseudoflavonifractor sp. 60]